MERRLAALFAADAVGYSRLMEQDEAGTIALLGACRSIIDATIARHGGRIFGTAGDSVVAEFASGPTAVAAALDCQEALAAAAARTAPDRQLRFRIGIHFGDVTIKDDDVLGDGINVAARLEGLAPPGGICVSGQVVGQLDRPQSSAFAPAGRQHLKNRRQPVEVWCWPPSEARNVRLASVRRAVPMAIAGLVAAAAIAVAIVVLQRESGPPPLPTGPRIAVLPFQQVGGSAEEAFFADGLGRDINAMLAASSNLFVIAPGATAAYRDDANCRTIRDELGADFILTGTVSRTADTLRVTTAFTDAQNCRALDAPGPFERKLDAAGVLDVQLEIARKVVSQIGSSDAPIFDAEWVEKMRDAAPDTLSAYDCVLLSYWFYENFAPDRHRRARACLENAVETDPRYSLGWSRLAFAYIETEKYSIDTPDDWAVRARAAAERAIDLDPGNADAYYALAILGQMLHEDRADFRANARRAVDLNPYDSFVLADLGTWMAYSGEWELGKEWVTRAKDLNPKHQSWWDWIWMLHAYLKGDYATAIEVGKRVNLPRNHMVQAALTAALAMNGDMAEAKATLAHVLELKPDYAADPRQPFRTRGMEDELVEGLMAGLRRAGLEVPPAPGGG